MKQQRPAQKSLSAASLSGPLSNTISQGLVTLARQHKMTPFMLLHAALALALSRLSHQQDIVIGTPVAGRTQAELEPLLGFFVNTLVLRSSTGFAQLKAYLAHIRAVNLAALGHQELPFEKLVDALKVPRTLSRTPLFQIMLTVHQEQQAAAADPLLSAAVAGLDITPLSSEASSCKFDLDVSIRLGASQGEVEFVYDTALFDHELIQQLQQQLCRILEDMAALAASQTPDIPLQQLGQIDGLPPQSSMAGLPQRLSKATASSDVTFQPASTALEHCLIDLWASVLATDAAQLSCRANFFDVGGNSLLALLLATRIQQQLTVPFTAAQVFACQTVQEQAAAIEALSSDRQQPSLDSATSGAILTSLRQGDPGKPALFLIHPLGGGVFCYRHLLQALNQQLPVFGLQCTDHHWPSLTAMASAYLSLARQAAPQAPLCLIGWSMGGVIAHEMQRLAAEQGDEAIQVVMIDSYPSRQDERRSDPLSLIASMAAELGIKLPANAQQLSAAMTEAQALQNFSQLAAAQHPQFAGISLTQWQQQLAVLSRNNQLFRLHTMQPSQGPCLLIAAENHRQTSQWSSYCQSLTTLTIPDSNHFSIVEPACSAAVATAVEHSIRHQTTKQLLNQTNNLYIIERTLS